MKFARSVASGILGVIIFVFLVAFSVETCVNRCSRNRDANEISWEDIPQQKVPHKEKSVALLRNLDGVGGLGHPDITLVVGGT